MAADEKPSARDATFTGPMKNGGGSDWLQAAQVAGLVAQSILLAVSAWWARGTVTEARSARREEAERFEREREDERTYRRIQADNARSIDLERRLDRVLEHVTAIDELRMQSSSDKRGLDARYEIGPAKRRLRAALAGIAMDLPQTGHLLHDQPQFPEEAQVDAALAEIEKKLELFAFSSTLPFEGESVIEVGEWFRKPK